MSQVRGQNIVSFKGNATMTAYVIVKPTAKNTVGICDTSTAYIVGVTADTSYESGASVPVVIGGTAKVLCGASVSAGAVVMAQTTTGYAVEATAMLNNTASSVVPKTLGIALEAGSTNSVIEVLIQINNQNKVAY